MSAPDGRTVRREQTSARVLDAVESLVKDRGDVSFSVRELAARAGVSPTTPFNHFGSKCGLLDALVRRSLEELSEGLTQARARSPLDRVFQIAEGATSFYLARERVYRPIYRELLGGEIGPSSESLAFAVGLWREALDAAVEAGHVPSARSIEILATQLELNWLGTLLAWVAGTLDAQHWLWRVEYSTGLLIYNAACRDQRPRIERRVRAVERKLSAELPGGA